MDIWEILCIVPTKDVAAIKRAYEQQIKYFNKTEDPEGHRRIEKAFAKALRYAGSWEAPAKVTNTTQEKQPTTYDERKLDQIFAGTKIPPSAQDTKETPIYTTTQFITKPQPQQKKGFPFKSPLAFIVVLVFVIKLITGIQGGNSNSTNTITYDSSYTYDDIGYDNVNEYDYESENTLQDYKLLESFKGLDASFIGKKRNVVLDKIRTFNYFAESIPGETGSKKFSFYYYNGDEYENTIGLVGVAFLGDKRIFFVVPMEELPSDENTSLVTFSGEFIKLSDTLYKKFMKDLSSVYKDDWAGESIPKVIKNVMFVYDGYDYSEWNY